MILSHPIPERHRAIQENFLTGEIHWKRLLLVQHPEYPMDHHAWAFA